SGPEPTDRAHAPTAPLSPAGRRFHDRFVAALDNDLDLPGAVATVREALRSELPADERRWLALDADLVLGLDLGLPGTEPGPADDADVPPAVRDLADRRAAARSSRDYATADALRDEIAGLGFEVVDRPAGQELRRR
ncbi:MAG TPA: hypothetical protein VFP22_03640, partial [Candidatus Limnocylindrales bacterium]|nr:hypothetical protein [Candidatus Limnocylindrales bacterium]